MKKIILSLVFVLGTGILISANSIPDKVIADNAGCARDCVDYSLETIEPMGNDTYERRMSAYLWIYEICYNSNCAE